MTQKNERLGKYLQSARIGAGIYTQQEAAEKIKSEGQAEGITVSQGLIGQYETGKIVDPNPKILRLMSRVYKVDYLELLYKLALDRHELDGGWGSSDLIKARWDVVESILKRFPTIGGVEGLETDQLRAKKSFLETVEILDIEGMAKWQKNFPDLEEFWVVAPNFLDDKDEFIRNAVIHNLKRHLATNGDGQMPSQKKVIYYYFVREVDIEGRMKNFRRALARSDDVLTEQQILEQIRSVPIKEEELRWITADVAIANPLLAYRKKAVGFSSVRQQNFPVFGLRIPDSDLEDIVNRLDPLMIRDSGANVEPFARRRDIA